MTALTSSIEPDLYEYTRKCNIINRTISKSIYSITRLNREQSITIVYCTLTYGMGDWDRFE